MKSERWRILLGPCGVTRWVPVGLMMLLLCLGGCAVNPVTGEQDFVLMSEDEEIALGRQYHPEVLLRYGGYSDNKLSDYVNAVGKKVAATSHRPNLIYRFTVLDSTEVNAFALPGGYIYVTRGLLAYLNSEADLAAVLGHEIGHVTARHAVRRHGTRTAVSVIGGVIASRSGTPYAGDIVNIFGTALVRGYGREQELESDRLGAEYLARSGYDPKAMLNVIGVLKNQELFERRLAEEEEREARVYHGVFSTHPDNDQRLREVVAKAEGLRVPDGDNTNRERYLHAIDGMVFGDGFKEGIRRDNRFYHANMRFALAFPHGWRIANQSDRIVARAKENSAKMILRVADINRRIPPRDFIRERMGIRHLKEGRALETNGLRGYTGFAELSSEYGARRGRVAAVYLGDRAYMFVGMSREAGRLERYDAQILESITSLHALSEAEKPLAEPLRIYIHESSENDRFHLLARDSGIPNHPEPRLRLLNDFYPEGEPKSGDRIKLVR